ncbi:MAG: ABC transporter ATP-binding protein [Desulfobacter sp.]|nr:ABC transporter ATP-binding protein [Desulfobacter sp.]
MGFLGPNGAGKTTTIKLCAGIINPNSGTILIHGKPVNNAFSRKKIGLLTENQYFPPHLTVKEWLSLLGRISGLSGRTLKEAMDWVLALFDLVKLGDSRIHTLSKGQAQRAGFAQALIHKPEILLLDEPMSGMDPSWRSRIQEILIAYKNRGGTLLFSSHILSDLARLSDHLTFITGGQIKWQGSANEVSDTKTMYEIIFRSDNIEKIIQMIPDSYKAQPDGSFRIILESEKKNIILKLAVEKSLSLSSITPLYPGLEELFV